MITRRSLAIGGLAPLLASARSYAQESGRFFLIYFRWNSAVLQPKMQRRVPRSCEGGAVSPCGAHRGDRLY